MNILFLVVWGISIFPISTPIAELSIVAPILKLSKSSPIHHSAIDMYPDLKSYLKSIETEFSTISEERKEKLLKLSDYISTNQTSDALTQLTFICTHNSRRSHFGQIWAKVAAVYYGLEQIATFSGGTEATAFNPRAVAAVQRAGISIEKGEGNNPVYQVRFSDEQSPITCFSKTYDDPTNPSSNFAAIMTCSDADKNCPHIPGASARFSIPYIDPKVSDGTDEEAKTYDERCRQIATEMMFVMSQVKSGDL